MRTRINLQAHRRRELVDSTVQVRAGVRDGNGDAHIKAGLVGRSETLSLIDGELGLSTWQGIFFCEFDGPRASRTVVCTVIADPAPEDRAAPAKNSIVSVNFEFYFSVFKCIS